MYKLKLNVALVYNFFLKLIFPFFHLVLNFTLSFLLLVIGFKGNISLVAEIAILQSINFMVFFPFNGNARNYMLNSNDHDFKENILNFRLLLFIPLLSISLLIGLFFVNMDLGTIVLLLTLSSTSWFLDIFITIYEKEGKSSLIIFLCTFFFFGFSIFTLNEISDGNINLFCIFLLSVYLPFIIFNLLKYCKKINISNFKTIFKEKILTQIGGTAVIGISSFALKNIILILLSKSMAGVIFMGYTLGGALATVFAYSLGPTLIYNIDIKKLEIKKVTFVLFLLIGFFVISTFILYIMPLKSIASHKNLFILCLILSCIGSILLIFALSFKLYVSHRDLKLNIFKFEFIINMITVISVSILILIFREYGAIFTYPLTGIASFIIYKNLYQNDRNQN